MKIKTVAVLGAGAVGSYVIWGLSRRKDIRLGVLAEGKRAEKLKKGCTTENPPYSAATSRFIAIMSQQILVYTKVLKIASVFFKKSRCFFVLF